MMLKKLFEIIKKHRAELVIGAIWGLVSGFLFPFCNIFASWYMCFVPRLLSPIFLLPAYIAAIPCLIVPVYSAWGSAFVYYLFIIPVSVFIGALIGAGIGYFIEKHKTKANNNSKIYLTNLINIIMNKTIIFSILIGILILAGCTQISKQNSSFVNCDDNYDCLYNEIKNGNSAKVVITEEIESLNIIEKSSVEVQPDNDKYKVTMRVIDLKKIKSDSEMDAMVDSIAEAISETCPQIVNNLNKIESKSAVCYTNTPEEAKELTIKGLNDDFISKYNCKGELIDTITDICVTPQFPNFPPGVDKPAVYLYPESEMNIKVSVNINGYITKSIPTYGIGYDVIAKPNGLIDDKYDYLFYEAQLNNIELPDTGWIVKSTDLETWFNINLINLGLNQKEIEQFKEYWIPKLSESDLYEIRLVDNDFLVNNMDLIVEPRPDTIIRRIFYFKPISENIKMEEPMVETPERIGFTVVEWGGILDN